MSVAVTHLFSANPPANNFLTDVRNARILIVDDVEINQLMIEKTLRARGFHNILIAENGQQALEQAELQPPDMVILDVQMPVMDGFECTRRLRQIPRYRDTPILVQTVLSQPEMRVKAFTQGATDIINKPIDPDELCARMLVHLEKQYYLRELRNYYDRTSTELDQARNLQLAILPDVHELHDLRQRLHLDLAGHFRPSSELGGDFWGVKKISAHQMAFWIVDFSGHGVEAAINVFRLQAYLKEHSEFSARPGEYLSQLNDKLLELLDIGQFATMFYGILDTKGQQLIYACAGSPHPLLWSHQKAKASLIDATGLPLGMGLHSYPTQKISFHRGDSIFFYSDALTETPDGRGNYTSEDDLMKIITTHHNKSAAYMVQQVLQQTISDREAYLKDDLTICACHWHLESARESL